TLSNFRAVHRKFTHLQPRRDLRCVARALRRHVAGFELRAAVGRLLPVGLGYAVARWSLPRAGDAGQFTFVRSLPIADVGPHLQGPVTLNAPFGQGIQRATPSTRKPHEHRSSRFSSASRACAMRSATLSTNEPA